MRIRAPVRGLLRRQRVVRALSEGCRAYQPRPWTRAAKTEAEAVQMVEADVEKWISER